LKIFSSNRADAPQAIAASGRDQVACFMSEVA